MNIADEPGEVQRSGGSSGKSKYQNYNSAEGVFFVCGKTDSMLKGVNLPHKVTIIQKDTG